MTHLQTRLKERVVQLMPVAVKRALAARKESTTLQRVSRIECNPASLRSREEVALEDLLKLPETDAGWKAIKEHIDIPDMTGGVNPGDRRAIYALIRKLKPCSVLEVGTHIGASTLHIALALSINSSEDGKPASLVSVDISDVNDPRSKPWLKYGMKMSPAEVMEKMNVAPYVEFVTGPSLDYLARCGRKFDFIFLDGDHAARTVYKEVPAALKVLEKDGVILLHDYFPNLEPLWSNGSVIPGPFLATERLKAEEAKVVVLPLGELPWPTKLRSSVTSLALLLGD